MRIILASALVLTMTATAAQKNTKKKLAKAQATTATTAAAPAPAAQISAAPAAGSTSTTTAQAMDAVNAAIKPWSLKASLTTYVPMKVDRDDATANETDNWVYLGYNHKLNDGAVNVGARQYFRYTDMVSEDAQTKGKLEDLMLYASTKNPGAKAIFGTDQVNHLARFYVPIGQASQAISQNGRLRYIGDINWDMGNSFTFTYAIDANFVHNNARYTTFKALNYLELGYAVNDKVDLYQDVGVYNNFGTTDDIKRASESFELATGVIYRPIKGLSLLVELSQSHDVMASDKAVSKYEVYKTAESTLTTDIGYSF